MHKVDAYLDCLPRQRAESIWWERLTQTGYFAQIPYEELPIDEALGRITAACLYARRSVPHYNGAAMDGIALAAQDSFGASESEPKELKLLPVGAAHQPGGCYIVDTGDLLPEGTNAVIMIEDVQVSVGQAQILAAAAPWQHVRIIGEDIVANELVLAEHLRLRPVDLAAALAAGLESVSVLAKPRVTVIPTGSELVEKQAQLEPGKILDVNSHMLCAAVREWGAEAKRHAVVPDQYDEIKTAVSESLAKSDMVILNAGTSAGTEDYTAQVLAELGEVLVHGVAIKPGKPVVLAVCDGKPVIGLPGYPVSAMLTADLFIKPVLAARQKIPLPADKTVEARLGRQIYSQVGVEEYLRVSLGEIDGRQIALPLGRGAGLMSSLTKAQGVISVSEMQDGLPVGASVTVRLLGDDVPKNSLLAVGSHDMALDILAVFLRRKDDVTLSCANVGSMGGILAIRNRETHLAGIHMLDEASGLYNLASVKKYLPDRPWRLLHFAMREQGLILARGNPKKITGISDLARADILFVNRQRGAGTRMLLDYRLKEHGIASAALQGYEKEVGTHMAVAATIAAGAADVGLGIRAAASALELDFISVGQEQYDLLVDLPEEDMRFAMLQDILQSAEFRMQVEGLGGYDLTKSGEMIASSERQEVR